MCMRTTCHRCRKPTWSGCGAHIEQAMRGVPVDQRCRCSDEASASEQKSERAPAKKRFLFF